MKHLLSAAVLPLLLATTICVSPAVHAGDAPQPAATLEAQIDALTNAAAEGLQQMDWKMVLMAVDGFKAAGLTGKDLELAVTRAERNAGLENYGSGAFGMGMGGGRDQVIPLGMTMRALLADKAANEKLKGWAMDDIAEVKPADNKTMASAPAEFIKAQKAYDVYTRALTRRNWAVLGLALLKDPAAGDRAIALLKAAGDSQPMFGMGMPTNIDPLVMAAVLSSPDTAVKKITDICKDETVALSRQTNILSTLTRMAGKIVNPADAYSLRADVNALLLPSKETRVVEEAQLPGDIWL